MAHGWFGRGPFPWLKPGILVGSLWPLASLALGAVRGTLEADAIAQALNLFGYLALIFLVASLACTPLKKAFAWTWPLRVRKLLGLLAFFYASLHLLTYLGPDQGFSASKIGEDLLERKFIAIGFLAFALLVPLAVTSTDRMVKRLGFQRWQRLHRLAYVAVAAALLHFVWRVKVDLTAPLIFAAIVLVLFGIRVGYALYARAVQPAPSRR